MLPILHTDWKPCLSVNIIVFALELFLSDPPETDETLLSSVDLSQRFYQQSRIKNNGVPVLDICESFQGLSLKRLRELSVDKEGELEN